MEHQSLFDILSLLDHPVLAAQDGILLWQNSAAAAYGMIPGASLEGAILTGQEQYATHCGDILYLTLKLQETVVDATLLRREGLDIFLLDHPEQDAAIRALALAAMELRTPLNTALTGIHRLDGDTRQLAHALTRITRIVCNMADAGGPLRRERERMNAREYFDELFEKCRIYLDKSGYFLDYSPLKEDIPCMIQEDAMERAVMNLLSNAMAFSPLGSTIRVWVTATEGSILLGIQDRGKGITPDIRGDVFRRYLRSPRLEDPAYGLGLGLQMVRNTAALHEGAVLLEQPEEGGTKVMLTLSRAIPTEATVRTPLLRVDYAGEQDHGLLEFAENLPDDAYDGSWR